MKVLFVIPGKEGDSQSMSFVRRLADSLRASGIEVDNIFVSKTANPFTFICNGLKIRRQVVKNNYDIVVAQFGTYVGLLVGLFSPRPKIVTYRGSDLNPVPTNNRFCVLLRHLASHIASFLVDGIICVSKEISERLICRQKKCIIPSSTDVKTFIPMNRAKCRKILGWREDSPIAIFFCGNNPRLKGVKMAESVKSVLAEERSGVEFVIISEEVPLREMPVYINASDCVVFLSFFEGSPNLIREVSSCNIPVLSVSVGDVEEVLEGITPSRVVARSIPDIVSATQELAQLRARADGREKMFFYSNENTAKKTVAFYSDVIARHKEKTG